MIPERNQKYNFNNQRQNKKYNYNTYVQLQYEINDDDDETNRVNMSYYRSDRARRVCG